MQVFKYIKFIIRDFIGLEGDYGIIVSDLDKIIEKLEKIEVESQQLNLSDYLTLKNLLILLIFLSFIGGGFWLYNTELYNNSVLELIKSLGNLTKDLHQIDQKEILETLKKLNENSVNMSVEKVKLLMEIKNLLLRREIEKNPFLSRPISEIIRPRNGSIVFGDFNDD